MAKKEALRNTTNLKASMAKMKSDENNINQGTIHKIQPLSREFSWIQMKRIKKDKTGATEAKILRKWTA